MLFPASKGNPETKFTFNKHMSTNQQYQNDIRYDLPTILMHKLSFIENIRSKMLCNFCSRIYRYALRFGISFGFSNFQCFNSIKQKPAI